LLLALAIRDPLFATPMRLFDRPYLLLMLCSLFWAGNTIVGRAAVDLVPPATLTFVRWAVAFVVLVPFVRAHLVRDWPVIRRNLPLIFAFAITGSAGYNVIAYLALHYTQAINSLLLQSVTPLFVALWSFALFRDRLTLVQTAGIVTSLTGVVVIVCRGDIGVLAHFAFNTGDIMILVALVFYALYMALVRLREHHPDGAAVLLRACDRARRGDRAADDCGLRVCRDLPLGAGLLLPQPRHRADRRQPRGAVHPPDAGVRVGPCDPVPRRAVAPLSRGRLRDGAHRRGAGGEEVAGRRGSCPGRGAAWSEAERCDAEPGPSDADASRISDAPPRKSAPLHRIRDTRSS
jgi:uncharacterized membrane protein